MLCVLFFALAVASATSALTLPVSIHGLSVSSGGFVALLCDTPRARLLPIVVNDIDTTTASSPEALTLLQLMQNIDLGGPLLPPELLQQRTCFDDPILCNVLISEPSVCTLRVTRQNAEADEADFECESPFEALALAMRYSTKIEADASLLDLNSFPLDECSTRFPSCFTRTDAAQMKSSITRKLAGLPCDDGEATPTDAQPQGLDLTALNQQFGSGMVAPKPPSGLNANKSPPGMLEKALAVARKKGDQEAVKKIESALRVEQLKRDLAERGE